jgi:hypothetical protein
VSVKIDPAVEFYDPATNNYRLADDPRCLYGWGPPEHGCNHRFGHMCCRELGHPGRCDDSSEYDSQRCRKVQRPKNWDTHGRAEANRWTASQRPERVGRDALIEAAMAHVVDEFAEIYADERRGTNRWGMFCSCGWRTQLPKRDVVRMEQKRFEHQLDAILPLIADAINAELRDTVSPGDPPWCQGYGVGMSAAEALVRSLGGEQ